MTKKSIAPKQTLLLGQTKRLLHESGLKARKGLAQHYLIDESALDTILAAAGIHPDEIIMEVGPGLGVLTKELVKRAGLVAAIELDEKLADLLRETFSSYPNLIVINDDVLKVDPVVLLDELKPKLPLSIASPPGYKVVANLPYYITSPVLRHFLEAKAKPTRIVVMVQKEVAEAIAARPGEMGILSVAVQFYGKPQIAGYVPAQAFYPPPKVDSAILRVDLYPKPLIEVETEGFFEVVRAGFSAARKQIGNSLAQGLGLSKSEVLAVLGKASIEPQRRAETLTIEEWGRLWQEFKKIKK